jgi:hypothetical protein
VPSGVITHAGRVPHASAGRFAATTRAAGALGAVTGERGLAAKCHRRAIRDIVCGARVGDQPSM